METARLTPSPFRVFARALSAEILKTRRTLALWLTFFAPLTIAVLNFVIMYQRKNYVFPEDENPWLFINRQNLIVWSLLMLPLFITLESALVAQLDHQNDNWKHLFTLPVPRWAVYVSKQTVTTLLIGLSMLILQGLTVACGLALRAIFSDLGLAFPLPVLAMLKSTAICYFAGWLILSIHNWVALRWRSFVVSSAFGIVMTVAGILIVNSDYRTLYPWALPAMAMFNHIQGDPYLTLLLVGSLGAVPTALLGCLEWSSRDVL